MFLIMFMIAVILSAIYMIFCIKKMEPKDFKIEKIDKNHRKISRLSYSFDKKNIIAKDPFPSYVVYQKKINNEWWYHNLNGPAVIYYDTKTGRKTIEQYYIDGKLCENELQYLIAISGKEE